MDPHPHPRPVGVHTAFASVEDGFPHAGRKTVLDCGGRAAYSQFPFKKNSSYSFSVRLLNVTFVSLAVVYLLLRCFDFTRKRSGQLTRSLAASDGRPCHGYGEDEQSEKDGEAGGEGGISIQEHGGTVWGRHAEGPFERLLSRTRGAVQLTPVLTTTDSGFPRGMYGSTSRLGQGDEGPTEFDVAHSVGAGPQELPSVQEVPDSVSGIQIRLHVEDSNKNRNYEGRSGRGFAPRLREGETLQMWDQRNLPPHVEQEVITMFEQMIHCASSCRLVVRAMTRQQRLRLVNHMGRLLALQLGALSLVQEHLERFRTRLGDALLKLCNEALLRSGQETHLEESRQRIRELQAVVEKLKQPRPRSELNVPHVYRPKMVSLVRTGTVVVEVCIKVLEGLSNFEAVNKSKPPPDLITQLALVLSYVYEAHSSYIGRDSLLRQHILNCQKCVESQPLLSRRHAQSRNELIPPLDVLVQQIRQAVRDAGGIPQSPSHATKTHQNAAPKSSASVQQASTSREPLDEEGIPTQEQEESYSALHPSSTSSGAGLQGLQAAAFAEPRPQQPWDLSARHLPDLAYSAQQEVATSGTPRYPQSFPSPLPHPLLSPSVPSMHVQPYGFQGALTNANRREVNGLLQIRTSEHTDRTAIQAPGVSPFHEAAPPFPSYPQSPRRAFAGPYAHAGFQRYPSHGGHNVSNQIAPPSLLPPTARPTVHASGAAYGWYYETVSLGTRQPEAPEQVQGMLGDLLKGGLKLEDVFPSTKPPGQ